MVTNMGFETPEEQEMFTELVTKRADLEQVFGVMVKIGTTVIVGGRQLGIGDDEIWAATAMNIGKALHLDLDSTTGISAAGVIATLLMQHDDAKG